MGGLRDERTLDVAAEADAWLDGVRYLELPPVFVQAVGLRHLAASRGVVQILIDEPPKVVWKPEMVPRRGRYAAVEFAYGRTAYESEDIKEEIVVPVLRAIAAPVFPVSRADIAQDRVDYVRSRLSSARTPARACQLPPPVPR